MGISTTIDVANNIRMHKSVGVINKALLLEKLSAVYTAPDFKPEMNVLWDFSHADLTSFTLDDLEDVARFVISQRRAMNRYKVALMASEPFGNLLFTKFVQKFGEQTATQVKIFKELAKAYDWLKLRRA